MISRLLCAGVLSGLAACGPLGQGATSSTLKTVAESILSGEAAANAQPAPQPALTRAAIEAADADLLLVSLVSRGSVDLLSPVSTRPGAVTWISSDGVSVSLRDGMVVATRASGFDLMGADTDAARRSLTTGGGSHSRRYDVLTGLDQIETDTYQCDMAFDKAETITIVERDFATRKFRETCKNDRVNFTNLYWVTSNGQIVQTRQFVSIGLGYLVYQRL